MGRTAGSVRVGRATTGQGLFAQQRFEPQQTIGEIRGRIIDDGGYGSDYCMDLHDGRLLEPDRPFRFINHSCDPNCEIFCWETDPADIVLADRIWLQAIRKIRAGEQLTIDYAWPASAAIPCRCGSPFCRGWIVSLAELSLLRVAES